MKKILVSIFAGTAVLLPAIFDSAIKGAVLLAVVALVVLLMRRASPAARHLVWVSGMAALLILPILSATLPGWRVLPDWTAPPPSVYSEPGVSEFGAARRSSPPARAEPAPQSVSEEATVSAIIPSARADAGEIVPSVTDQSSLANPALWIGGIWAGVAGLLLFRLIGCSCRARSSMRRAEVVAEGPLAEALAKARSRLKIRRRVTLLLDACRIVPFVWGVFRPRLVLPAEARTWDEERLRSVLLHELAHVKRHDLLVMWLTQLVCAVYWFNPLVWLAAWRLRVECERACDDLVLNSGVKASDYAEHLLQVATQLETGATPGALAMARPSRLEGRLLAVLKDGANRSGITRALALAAICFAALSVVPVAMLKAADKEKSVTRIAQAPAPGGKPAAEFSTLPEKPWTATGRVMDPKIFPKQAIHSGNLDRIADLSQVWVEVEVHEYDLPLIKIGQEAKVQVPDYPTEEFPGEVDFIDPYLNPKSRTAKIRLVLDNSDVVLKPGMSANVTIGKALQASDEEKSVTRIAQAPVKAAEFSPAPENPWTVTGRVTDPNGNPLAKVEIRVRTGIGTLLGGAATQTDEVDITASHSDGEF